MELVKNRREGRATGGAGEGSASGHLDAMEYSARQQGGMNTKLKQQDLAGSINRDRQNLRLAELQLLFQVGKRPFLCTFLPAGALLRHAPVALPCAMLALPTWAASSVHLCLMPECFWQDPVLPSTAAMSQAAVAYEAAPAPAGEHESYML